jgi:hypothetical protein
MHYKYELQLKKDTARIIVIYVFQLMLLCFLQLHCQHTTFGKKARH